MAGFETERVGAFLPRATVGLIGDAEPSPPAAPGFGDGAGRAVWAARVEADAGRPGAWTPRTALAGGAERVGVCFPSATTGLADDAERIDACSPRATTGLADDAERTDACSPRATTGLADDAGRGAAGFLVGAEPLEVLTPRDAAGWGDEAGRVAGWPGRATVGFAGEGGAVGWKRPSGPRTG